MHICEIEVWQMRLCGAGLEFPLRMYTLMYAFRKSIVTKRRYLNETLRIGGMIVRNIRC